MLSSCPLTHDHKLQGNDALLPGGKVSQQAGSSALQWQGERIRSFVSPGVWRRGVSLLAFP